LPPFPLPATFREEGRRVSLLNHLKKEEEDGELYLRGKGKGRGEKEITNLLSNRGGKKKEKGREEWGY